MQFLSFHKSTQGDEGETLLKQYTIFAGVNGAGKTSLYNTVFSKSEALGKRINLDEIVRELGDWRDNRLQLEAGQKAVRLVHQFLREGISFHQETTLAGKSIFHTIKKAKNTGFEIVMYYVGVNNYDIAKERIQSRIAKGGHGVDENLVEKRFSISLEHLKLAIPLCDTVHIYDNSSDTLSYILSIKHGVIEETALSLPQWFESVIL